MRSITGFLMTLILAAIVGFIALGELNQSITERNNSQAAVMNAQAVLVSAQAESRLNASQAALPFVVLGIGLTVAGAVIIAALVVAANRPDQPSQPAQAVRIIERQIILVLPTGASRREMWQTITANVKQSDARLP
jgi:hypothetical protein